VWQFGAMTESSGVDSRGDAWVALHSTIPPLTINHTMYSSVGANITFPDGSVHHYPSYSLKITMQFGNWIIDPAVSAGLEFRIKVTSNDHRNCSFAQIGSRYEATLTDPSTNLEANFDFENEAFVDGSTTSSAVNCSGSTVASSSDTIYVRFPPFASSLWYDPSITAAASNTTSAPSTPSPNTNTTSAPSTPSPTTSSASALQLSTALFCLFSLLTVFLV